MNLNITKRDSIFFILGFLTFFLINFIFINNDVAKEIKKGFFEGYKSTSTKLN